MTKPTLALQVYSVRDVYLEDKAATLEKIAKAGTRPASVLNLSFLLTAEVIKEDVFVFNT